MKSTVSSCMVPLKATRRGATLLDVVVVVVVILLLLILLTPVIHSARETSRQHSCANHLRTLMTGLRAYHDAQQNLPAAAIWRSPQGAVALHRAKRIDRVTSQNWVQAILPWLDESQLAAQFDPGSPIGSDANAAARLTQFNLMRCPADDFNRPDNPYQLTYSANSPPVQFARGNYAINGGSHNMDVEPPSTSRPRGDFQHLVMDASSGHFSMWGNGVAGINTSFTFKDFANGQSTLVALEEVRAGIDPMDARGSWALGQIGSSISWGHGVNSDAFGPNNLWERADDIMGCQALHDKLGDATLSKLQMPCVHYVDYNQQATARSRHDGGVQCAFLDGSVRFIANCVDPGLWHVMHSRETPASVLAKTFEADLAMPDFVAEAIFVAEPACKLPETATNSLGMTFVRIPAGQFEMGLGDVGNVPPPSDAPPHPVQISQPYMLATSEVTRADYRAVMGAVPEGQPAKGERDDQLPATGITWDDAALFCQELSQLPEEIKSGCIYRLPTEAEWEFACRAGKSEPFSWNADQLNALRTGEMAGVEPALPLQPVGSFPPNEFGLFDMRGNAWEWTADWFDRDYYSRSPLVDPQGPDRGFIKVVRGGDWRYVGERCLIDYAQLPPWKSNPFVGFRVVQIRSDPSTNP